jgi:hypothetical protein
MLNIVTTAYGDMINEYMENGWDAYLLTFMFNHLRGSPAGVQIGMEREVERVYAKLLTRIVRKPRSLTNVGKLPLWIVVPDFPVPKRERTSLDAVTVNDGRHIHAIGLNPPTSRLQVGLDEHFREHQDVYVGSAGRLQRIHAVPITHDPAYVADYVFKSLKRGWVGEDDVFILPKVRSELSEKQFLSTE